MAQSQHWTPRALVTYRRWRVLVSFIAALAACFAGFMVNTRKSIALEVNGRNRIVTTYASSLPELLKEQHIVTHTHDQALASSGY